nr:hypothetical protein [Vibrio sp. D173a]
MSNLKAQLKALKVIPVIAIDRAEDIIPLGKVLAENVLPAAEITFRSDAAVEAIRLLREAQPDMLIGAGTVLNREQAIAAKEAGQPLWFLRALTQTLLKLAKKLVLISYLV